MFTKICPNLARKVRKSFFFVSKSVSGLYFCIIWKYHWFNFYASILMMIFVVLVFLHFSVTLFSRVLTFSRRALRFHYFLSVSEAFHYFGITITRELSWLFSIWGRDYSELSLLVTTHQKFYDDVLTPSFRAAKHI